MGTVTPIDLPDAQERRIRWNFRSVEICLAGIQASIARIDELSDEWRDEYASDVEQLREKLRDITTMIDREVRTRPGA